MRVHACERGLEWRGWGIGGVVGGVETGYVGYKTKHRKVSHDLKHGVDLFGLRKNLLHVVWRRECFPSLLSIWSDTTHGNIFGEATGLWGEKKAPDILFLLPLFIAFSVLFKLIGFHTSVHHMWKHPNEYWRFGEGL